MNRFLRGVTQATVESFPLPEPILEIGSYQVEEQGSLVNLRDFFPGKSYIGVDFRPGPGVDCVADVEHLPQESRSVGTVIALNTFEHVRRFWVGFEEIHRVLRPDGVFFVSCPFYFHQHAFPNDYWRFTPEALTLLLEPYPTRILGWQGPEGRPAGTWAIAFREQALAPGEREFSLYQQRLKQYARDPLPWQKKVRYQMGRILFGRGPFAPKLERDRWVTIRQGQAA